MRLVILMPMILVAGNALAASIENVTTAPLTSSKSITSFKCETCPPVDEANKSGGYVVPALKPGEFQRTEIREVNGKRKVFRTENFYGGSPSVFVSTPIEDIVPPPIPAPEPEAAAK